MTEKSAQRIVVLLSGRGSNYRALRQAQADGRLDGEIAAVVSDQPDAAGLGLARDDDIETFCVPRAQHPDRTTFEQALAEAIAASGAHWIVLAGFMRVLSARFVQAHAGRMVNIHPSLLPRHRGLNTHQRVLAAGESEHGASVHFVTPELDGGPVISQVRLKVEPGDTADQLAERLLPLEHRLFPATMALLLRYPVEARDESISIQGKTLSAPLVLGRDLSDDGRLLDRRAGG
ncbi:phosphoribosylglycinamide formyltransferase [Wenzhouxiangella limi]|uniref:Phosphoribosylglycinamide formyltransferase n=1 Tax=Wenzhouxiangella limi TaxID=2707351 RepID=A0A845V1S7_9GAMM|nr:phosphoribosylglycinamide formyltransferase [Wenzhouxiangella limi]NDY96552.1 phosphoribosylglycinamide formyltransferase [Wenzhouxiangella limi]